MLADLPSVTEWPKVPQMPKTSQKDPGLSGTTLETRNRRDQGTKNTEESGSYKHEVFLFTSISYMPAILYAGPEPKASLQPLLLNPIVISTKGKQS